VARRDPSRPQLDFPQLTADLIDQLNIRGPVGLLNFEDIVQPVFLIGSRGVTVDAVTPEFTSSEMIAGRLLNPGASSNVFDTGQLTAGTYDIFASISASGTLTAGLVLELVHRNALNNGDVRTLLMVGVSATQQSPVANLPMFGYVIAQNERFILRCPSGGTFGGVCAGTMGLSRRLVP